MLNGRTVTVPNAERDILKHLLMSGSFGQYSSVTGRADPINDAGLPDERFPAWQDREWALRPAQHSHIKPIADPLTNKRTGLPDSITSKFEQKRDVANPLYSTVTGICSRCSEGSGRTSPRVPAVVSAVTRGIGRLITRDVTGNCTTDSERRDVCNAMHRRNGS